MISKGDLGDATMPEDNVEIVAPDGNVAGKPPGTNAASTSGTIFEAQWKDNKLRIRGLAKGSGNMELFDKNNKKRMIIYIYVTSPQKMRIVQTLKKILKDVEGVRVYMSGDDIYIDGELFTSKDRERIQELVRNFSTGLAGEAPAKVVNLTTYSPLYMQAMAKKIEKAINDPEIFVKPLKDKFLLTGTITYIQKGMDTSARAMAEAKERRYREIAQAYISEIDYTGTDKKGDTKQEIVSIIKLVPKQESQELDKLIRIQFDFVELLKGYVKRFGFKWAPGMYSGEPYSVARKEGLIGDTSYLQVDGAGITGVLTGTINNLFPKLQNARQFNHARVLESSQVMTKNAQQTTFDSGTTFLLPMLDKQSNTTSYEKVNIGLKSTYTPVIVEETKTIAIDINLTYESLPESGEVTGNGAGIKSHTIRTNLLIESGKSAAIGGLIRNVNSKMYDQMPSEQAIQNSLFSIYHSKDFRNEKSQLIMFITPTIVEDSSAGGQELKKIFGVK